ncbi:MAG: cation:proton antiporter [Acidobacteriota bacterium]
MNELSSLGLILLLALLAGHVVKFLRIPEVTGYILAGIALGPSFLGWLSHENLSTLSIFSEVTLGLILFSVGGVFDISKIGSNGRRIVILTLIESFLAAGLVFGTMLAFGQRWEIGILLGAIAMETAVASSLMVIRELDPLGPLTDTLMAVMAFNNILALVAFSLVSAFLELKAGLSADLTILRVLYEALFPLVWQLIGSTALGYLCGLMLATWASQVTEHGEMLILLSGAVLLTVGASRWLELSPLLASLAVGATMVNFSGRSDTLFKTLSRTDPPLYAIFFVIAGADLNVSLITTIGFLGLAYVVARAAGKFFGASIGARYLDFEPAVKRYLGYTLFTQAGLAIGITFVVQRQFPELAPTVNTVVLASIVIYEVVGPLSTKFAFIRSGEVQATPSSGEPAEAGALQL